MPASKALPLPSPNKLVSLQEQSPSCSAAKPKTTSKSKRLIRRLRSALRSIPDVMNPPCRMPNISHHLRLHDMHLIGGTRMTGTLFGSRKSRVSLAIQENPRCLPVLVLELSLLTGKLLQDIGSGLVRIAMECEKHPHEKTKLMDKPIWSMYCNGRKGGYGVKREPTDGDLNVLQMLHAVSMGAGVLPLSPAADSADAGDLTYMRAFFERVVGSKDSETYYMINPDANSGPDQLTIFFVRV
ncbi:hypothetical protein NMG60_11029628 [Bertholletia excelsa]